MNQRTFCPSADTNRAADRRRASPREEPPIAAAAPEVWLVMPSANPGNCAARLPLWRERGYRIALLQDRLRFDAPADRILHVDRYPGWPMSINLLCRDAVPPSADIIVAAGDDMLPDPDHSAQELAVQFLDRFPDRFGVMQPIGDTYLNARHYAGSPWLGRAWCDAMYHDTGPFWPGYHHNWADNELYWLARCMDAFWERPDLTQRHEHFARAQATNIAPAYWTASARGHDRRDVDLFIARAAAGFPGYEPRAIARRFDRDRFDALYTSLAEVHRLSAHGTPVEAPHAERRMRRALQGCADAGRRRVMIYSAGGHTHAVVPALADSPAPIIGLIDDSPALAGQTRWGWPIVPLEQAQSLRPDAVILSSNTREDELAGRCALLELSGVEVVRLYEEARSPVALV